MKRILDGLCFVNVEVFPPSMAFPTPLLASVTSLRRLDTSCKIADSVIKMINITE